MYNYSGSKKMKIAATELKQNLSKYLKLSASEPIFITKNGKIVSVLTAPSSEETKIACLESVRGILHSDMTRDEIREARLKKYEDPD